MSASAPDRVGDPASMPQQPASAASPRNRRIAIVTHEYFPVLCGGTTMAHNLAVEFAALGHTTEIWTCRIGCGLPNVEWRDSITVRRFFTARLSRRDSRLWEHLSFVALGLPQMVYALWKHPSDTLLSIFVVRAGLLGLGLSWIFRARSFVHVDAADIPGIDSAMKRLTRYLGFIVRIVSRHSAGMMGLPGSVWVTPTCSDQRFCVSRGRQAVSCLRRSAAAPACTDAGKRARRRDHESGGSKGLALDESLNTREIRGSER